MELPPWSLMAIGGFDEAPDQRRERYGGEFYSWSQDASLEVTHGHRNLILPSLSSIRWGNPSSDRW